MLRVEVIGGRLGGQGPKSALLAGLIARWARHTRDGDMVGGDFPAWLADLLGYRAAIGGVAVLTAASGLLAGALAHGVVAFLVRQALQSGPLAQ